MSPDGLITIEQLGKQVKAKYPVYASKSDTEVGQAVLKKYPVYQSRVQPAAPENKPEARTVGNYLKEGATAVGRGVKNDAEGLYQTLRHPVDTGVGMIQQINEADAAQAKEWQETAGQPLGRRLGATALTALEKAPVIGPMVERAEQGGERMGSPEAFGAAVEGATTFAAPELAGKGLAKIIPKAAETARAITGTGPRATTDLVKDTKTANEASAAKASEAKAVEDRRGGLQKDIHEKSRELQGRIETARNNALKEGNQKYEAVNKKLNPLPADEGAIQRAVTEAKDKLKGTGAEPDILKKVAARVESGDYVYQGGAKFGPGTPLYEQVKASREGLPRQPGSKSKPFMYEDLQGTYSELGTELSKGNLPGDTYTALDTLHEAIGNEMQRIADSQGVGPQLTEARNYWRQMKQTFGKPRPPRDAATKTLNSLSPEFAKADASGNAVRMLSRYDPEIGKAAGEVTEARKGLKSLPKAKPTDAPTKKIGAEDIRARKAENLAKTADSIRNKGGGLASTFAVMAAIRSLMHGDLMGVGEDIAVRAAFGAGKSGLASLLESKPVVEWLTKATPADLKQIPPDMYNQVGPLIAEAQKKGIKIAPALIAATQGAAVSGQARKGVAAALRPSQRDEFMAADNPKGLVEKGNLPIWNRPSVQNDDGSHSTEYSTSFEDDSGHEVLVPTVVRGKFLTPDGKKPEEGSAAEKSMFKAAWENYLKTGENLGKFDSPDDADAYASVLHNRGSQ